MICYLESLTLIHLINNMPLCYNIYGNEIGLIKKLMPLCEVPHTLHEGNQWADVLAKLGANSLSPLHVLMFCMIPQLQADALGVVFPRL